MLVSDANVELVDVCNVYDVAPYAPVQLNVTDVGMPVLALTGEMSDGAAGAGGGGVGIVVKLHTPDHALAPWLLRAFTRQ